MDGDTQKSLAPQCTFFGEHVLNYDASMSDAHRSVNSCVCGYFETNHEEGTGA